MLHSQHPGGLRHSYTDSRFHVVLDGPVGCLCDRSLTDSGSNTGANSGSDTRSDP